MSEYKNMLMSYTKLDYYEDQLEPSRDILEWQPPKMESVSEEDLHKQDDCVRQGVEKIASHVSNKREPAHSAPVLAAVDAFGNWTTIDYRNCMEDIYRYPGRWFSIAMDPERSPYDILPSPAQFAAILANALIICGLEPELPAKFVCLPDNPEWLHKLSRAHIPCLYSEGHEKDFHALLPSRAAERGKLRPGGDANSREPLFATTTGLKLNVWPKYAAFIASQARDNLCSRQYEAICQTSGSFFSMGDRWARYTSPNLYKYLMSEENFAKHSRPYVNGSTDGGCRAVRNFGELSPGTEYRNFSIEVPLRSEDCRKMLDDLHAKYDEIDIVLSVWKRCLRHYGLTFDIDKKGDRSMEISEKGELISRTRKMFAIDSAIDAAFSGVPLDYLSF